MKSTALLVPRPFDILNKPIGIKVPIMLGTPRVPYEKVQRLRSISRIAPENASEAINGLGADPVAPAPSVWSSINDALSQPAVGTLAQTGVNFYVQRQTNQANAAMLNAQAQTAALQAQLAQQRAAAAAIAPKSGMPGWVIPVAAVGVVVLAATFFFLRK